MNLESLENVGLRGITTYIYEETSNFFYDASELLLGQTQCSFTLNSYSTQTALNCSYFPQPDFKYLGDKELCFYKGVFCTTVLST